MSHNYKFLIVFFVIISLLATFFFIQSRKVHLEQDQAKFYVSQIIRENNNMVAKDTLIDRKIASTIASKVLSRKIGKWRTFFYKPFDIYLIDDYWFVYGPISKHMLDYGPMLIINCRTGEIMLQAGYQ
ncbi:MAG TPA: hypothetical protein PLN06_03780 [Bacteroidales bacterium]|nr:hypothetical protein [Bacteroidales bacterium]HCI55975.1 hypothetical protein [Bacteroidales bacterium]HOU95726.1 hypothetical protein [Bacteroidales bacterium]HQG52886.1 hypothetical protein [Bacteroidales bacterium]HQJ20205.1 hypothetical protein [Bacteroidales bacterium]